MSEAAVALGVNNHAIRRLIHDGVLKAEQVMRRAPWQIRADLKADDVKAAITRKHRPCRVVAESQLPMFTDT